MTAFSPRTYQPRALEIIDTTLREGQQSSLLHDHFKYYFTTQDKLDIARALILFGVKYLELFAPNVSAQEASDFAAIRQVRDELVYQRGYAFLLAHVRCHPADVEAAIAAGADGLNMYIGTSDVSVRHNHGFGLDEIARRARDRNRLVAAVIVVNMDARGGKRSAKIGNRLRNCRLLIIAGQQHGDAGRTCHALALNGKMANFD